MLSALIMAGGKGTRFWPLSTEAKPKQFLKLIGDKTMIQMTVDRIKPIIPLERIFVCTGESYVGLVKEQLSDLPERNIIIEPEGRNTAPCIALSSLIINRYYKSSNMLVLPSDHLIKKENEFRDIVKEADEFINKNQECIVTLGIKPSRAETGYGYIKLGENNHDLGVSPLKVDKFVEKPTKDIAEKYLSSGKYLWNSGMFIWKVNSILKKIEKNLPNTFNALKDISALENEEVQEFINNNYHNVDNISIDYGILEKDKEIYVIPSEIDWDDIGTWNAVERYKEKDSKNNIVSDNVKVIKSESNIALNNEKEMIMIGVKDIAVIESNNTIYIVNRKYMNNLNEYKNIIKSEI